MVCMDESSKPMVGEVTGPVPAVPGPPKLVDDEYVRNGVSEILMEVEPLAGMRHVGISNFLTCTVYYCSGKGRQSDSA